MRLKVSLFVLLIMLAPFRSAAAQTSPFAPSPFSDDLDVQSLDDAIRRSLDYLEKLPPGRVVGVQPKTFSAGEVADSLKAFAELLRLWSQPRAFAESLRAAFDILPAIAPPDENQALFTAYYQPVIEASLRESPRYRFPIYGKPTDLIAAERVTLIPELSVEKVAGRLEGERFVPYYTRSEIDQGGAIRGRGWEIAWVKNPVDLFFLHVQGSGILRLEDGRQLYVSYAASNGRPYHSIGRLLVDRGEIAEEEMSMRRLRRYLSEHPKERDDLLASNERYVFFRFVQQGPLGSIDVPLTAGRSLATDSLFPKGALAFILANKPVLDTDGNLIAWQPFSRFVLNQDAGGAIRGPKRADLYFGSGDVAGAAAGFMKSPGRIYFLIKKGNGGEAADGR